jgi:two-component system response regulator ResD
MAQEADLSDCCNNLSRYWFAMTCVLVVDDEPIVRDVVVRYLEQAGFDTRQAEDGIVARELLEQKMPNAIVLDLMMPRMDGLELCRWIRARSDVPVIMLTALGEEADRIVGLELGADDYVAKPFSPRELAVRVKAVLRRTTPGAAKAEHIEVGDLSIDAGTREVAKAGRSLRLTVTEFDLLWFLVSHPHRVFSRQQLMQSVWGYQASFDTGTVTVHIRRLREKIESDPSKPEYLETVWGVGYRFMPAR